MKPYVPLSLFCTARFDVGFLGIGFSPEFVSKAELPCPFVSIEDIYLLARDGPSFFPVQVVQALQPDENELLLMVVYTLDGTISSFCFAEILNEGRDAFL